MNLVIKCTNEQRINLQIFDLKITNLHVDAVVLKFINLNLIVALKY